MVSLSGGALLIFLSLAYCTARPVFPYDAAAALGTSLSPFLVSNQDRDPAAGKYRVIGGVSMDRPSCVSWGPGRVDCFIRGEDSAVYHWWKEDEKYQDAWESRGGIVIGHVECVSRAPGIIELMVLGTNNAVFTMSYTGKWSPWSGRGGQMMETPSCVARTDKIINCFMRGNSKNAGFSIDQVDGKWGAFGDRGGILSSPISISRRSDSVVDVFSTATDNAVFQMTSTNGAWGSWQLRAPTGTTRGQPTAVSWDEKRIDVFQLGVRNQLMHLYWNGNWAKAFEDLGGRLQEVPSCLTIGTDIHCFGIGPMSYLYRKSYTGGKWTDWMNAYGAFIGRPSCIVTNLEAKEVTCYARGFSRAIVELVYKL